MRRNRAFKIVLRSIGGLLAASGLAGLFYTLHLCTGGVHDYAEPSIHRMMIFSVAILAIGALLAWLPEIVKEKHRGE